MVKIGNAPPSGGFINYTRRLLVRSVSTEAYMAGLANARLSPLEKLSEKGAYSWNKMPFND